MVSLTPTFNTRTANDGPIYADYLRLAQGQDAVAAGIAGKIVVGSVKKAKSVYDHLDVVVLAAKLHNQYPQPFNPNAGRPTYECYSSDSFTPDADPEPQPGQKAMQYLGNIYNYECRKYDEEGNLVSSCPFAQWTTEKDARGNEKRVPPKCETVLTMLVYDVKTGIVGQLVIPRRSFSNGERLLQALGDVPYTRFVRIQPMQDGKSQFYKLLFVVGDEVDSESIDGYEARLQDYAPTFFPKQRETPAAPAPAQAAPVAHPQTPIGQPARPQAPKRPF